MLHVCIANSSATPGEGGLYARQLRRRFTVQPKRMYPSPYRGRRVVYRWRRGRGESAIQPLNVCWAAQKHMAV